MTEILALARTFDRADSNFFVQHPDRRTHIRSAYQGECEREFATLGSHERNRRRVILTRAGFDGNFLPDRKILKIPFLAFADETIEDDDRVLWPLLDQIMLDAQK